MPNYGTLSTLDTLASSQQTIAQYGEDKAFEGIAMLLAAHNANLEDMLMPFIEITEDRQRRYGGGSVGFLDEVDQFGRADASKDAQGVTVGFPLRKFQDTLQWTRDYFDVTTAAELMAQMDKGILKDLNTVERTIKRAIFNPTNYTIADRYVDNVQLAVKAFVNADGADLPPGPNGESFDPATHTHYLYSSTLTAASQIALITTTIEHFGIGTPVVEINAADEAAYRALTGFREIVDTRIIVGNATTYAAGALDVVNFNNRQIGIFNGAEIWVKSNRIPPNYQFAYVKGEQKPLVMRRRNPQRGAFRLVADNEQYPLRAQTSEREFGVAVWNRVGGAVNFSAASGAYVAPTF